VSHVFRVLNHLSVLAVDEKLYLFFVGNHFESNSKTAQPSRFRTIGPKVEAANENPLAGSRRNQGRWGEANDVVVDPLLLEESGQ
jgi:hypothetical protein